MSPALIRAINEATHAQLVEALAYLSGWVDSSFIRGRPPLRSASDTLTDFFNRAKSHESRVR